MKTHIQNAKEHELVDKRVIGGEPNTIYKCRCGMTYTEDRGTFYELAETGYTCPYCREPMKSSTSRVRPVMSKYDSSHEFRGYWRCSCGHSYVKTLSEFINFDRTIGRCHLCATQLRIHSDTRNIGSGEQKTEEEEIRELLKSPFFGKGDEEIIPVADYKEVIEKRGTEFLKNLYSAVAPSVEETVALSNWGIDESGQPIMLEFE